MNKLIERASCFPLCLMHHTACSTTYPVVFLILLMATSLMSPWRAFLDLSMWPCSTCWRWCWPGRVMGAGWRSLRPCADHSFLPMSVPPHFSLAITDIQYILAAVIMLVVALLVGRLTANLRTHVEGWSRRRWPVTARSMNSPGN